MEPAKLETSIGTIRAVVQDRHSFTLMSAQKYGEAWPYFYWLTIKRDGERWEFAEQPVYKLENASEIPMPAELVDELLALGIEWASAHPEAFERAARAEFDDMILKIVDETFDEITRICSDAPKRFRRILSEPEFANHASTPLRRRVQKEGPTAARNAPPGQRRGEGH
jgi:hypothetical protein